MVLIPGHIVCCSACPLTVHSICCTCVHLLCVGGKEEVRVVIKSKALDSETYNLVNKMAQGCGLDLAQLFEQHKRNTGFM